MSVKISIIVPCYKQAEFLEEALSSVQNQSFDDWECIIVNDGSPDNTAEIAEKWQKLDSRFKYLEQINLGVSAARNFGISQAEGKYILPLDADDKIGENYLECCLNMIETVDYRIVYGQARCFGDSERKLELGEPTLTNLLEYNRIHNSGLFYKEDWEISNGYDINMNFGFEDWELWINILRRGGQAALVEQCVLYYRIKSVSRSTEIDHNQSKRNSMINYIFQKHINLYGYNSSYELYVEKLKLEKELKNACLNFSYKKILSLFFNKLRKSFRKVKKFDF